MRLAVRAHCSLALSLFSSRAHTLPRSPSLPLSVLLLSRLVYLWFNPSYSRWFEQEMGVFGWCRRARAHLNANDVGRTDRAQRRGG